MTDQNSYFYPGGVPITPQARRFGYEFPMYVSKNVWNAQCIYVGNTNKYRTNTERRIVELLQYCYDGMAKKLAVQDDFVYYTFKIWYWCPVNRNKTKKRRARLAARLFLDPDTNKPWLYIFNPTEDKINELTEGKEPTTDQLAIGDTGGCRKDSGQPVHVHGEIGDILEGSSAAGSGEPVDEQSNGQD